MQYSAEDSSANRISAEIVRLLVIGAIESCGNSLGVFASSIFCQLKINGGTCVNLNMRKLNEFIKYEKLKIEFVTELG